MTLLVALLCALVLPAASSASRNQLLTFEAPRDLLDPASRDTALGQLDSLGVKSLRVVMYWKDVAPQSGSKNQPDFDTTDPAGYDFSRVDPVLDAAKARGWPVLLTVSGPVPRWATRDRKDNVTRPNPSKFAQFMTAVGRHFKDRVAYWSVWNEPNHPAFLAPQYDSKQRPVSPGLYRQLFLAAQRGLASAKVPSPQILMGETAPRGTGKDVAPLTFLRGALCLSASYKATSQKCDQLDIAGFAHHAYTTRSGPYFVPPGTNDVTIGVLPRLVSALDKAARAKAIPANTPIYLTEFGIQSEPDPIFGVSFQRQAEYRAISERIAYDNTRVKSFSQYLLTDDAPLTSGPKIARYSGFESGLITASGKAKPSLDAFRLSLVSTRRSPATTSIWGVVRPATVAGSATLEYRAAATGAFRTFKTVTYNRLGYFALTAPYKAGRQYRLVWTAPDGTVYRGAPTRTYSG
ncbi:MAG: hypothetical protein JWM93_2158 [Frankiales bacterium]|nr:hypothetical protein [Frankiales bacterium]MCW3017501.1 hypothetical protein [Solirubrobacterales bacterium]